MPAASRLAGYLSIPALEQALNEVIRRHEIMRVTFTTVDGRPWQRISTCERLELKLVDLSLLKQDDREARIQSLAKVEIGRPFDLSRGPLLRIVLLRLREQEHVVILTMHHIISDGWSLGILINEVGSLYQVFTAGTPSSLPELPIQYTDFAAWQRKWLTGKVLREQLAYWIQQLDGAPAFLNIPADRPRSLVQTFRGESRPFVLPGALHAALKMLSHEEGVTLFITLLTAFQILLYLYTGQEDISVGAPITGRSQPETEGLIGVFVNLLALRTRFSGDLCFREALKRVRDVVLEAHEHQDLPFAKIVEELRPERNLSYMPLVQVAFTLHHSRADRSWPGGLRLSSLGIESGTARFDLALLVVENEQGLSGALLYNTDLFYPATILRMLKDFKLLIEKITINTQGKLLDFNLGNPGEDEGANDDALLQRTDESEQFSFHMTV
jgi:hypothetical protein